MVKSGLRICGSADVDIDKLELNFIFRLRVSVRVGVRVRVSISIYLIDVIKLRIGSVLTNNIRKSAVRFLPIALKQNSKSNSSSQ